MELPLAAQNIRFLRKRTLSRNTLSSFASLGSVSIETLDKYERGKLVPSSRFLSLVAPYFGFTSEEVLFTKIDDSIFNDRNVQKK